jgi:hypothetical protein
MFLTRRTLLIAGLSSLGGPARAASRTAVTNSACQPPPIPTDGRYIMPVAAGSRNGDSWAKAASLSQLNFMIAAVGPGGIIYVLADAGPYSVAERISVNKGGRATCHHHRR